MEKDLTIYQAKKSRGEKIALLSILGIIAGVVALIFGGAETAFEPIGFALIGIGILGFIVGTIQYSSAINKFKKEYLKEYFSSIIEEGEYFPKKGLSSNQVYQSGFLKRADRFKSYDYLGGIIDGVRFQSSDCHLQEKRVRYVTVNGKTRRKVEYITYFKGRLFTFDFNKSIDHPLQVLEKFKPEDGQRYKKVDLESIAFNKKFNTYTTDPHTAFYVLTPHFMESLMKIEGNHPGRLGFSFMGPQMHFGINDGKGLFQIMPFRKIDNKLLETFKEDIDKVYELVDDLKLNKNIFKEEV